ncbi:phosphotransferase [Kitasatospora cineracea]|uniref:phosphotransferase n=1 Tax=Kitasatospora cineracea TaxID=88074 RepID=UPI00380BDAB3
MPTTRPAPAKPARTVTAADPVAGARAALSAAAALQGIDPDGAELLQTGLNFTFRLPSGVIAKVHGPHVEYIDALRQVRAARALLAAGIPTAAPVGRISHPIAVHRMLVTFSEDLGPERPSAGQLGDLVARLHRIEPLTHIGLRPRDLVAEAATRLDLLPPTTITDRDRAHLHRFLTEAAAGYDQVAPWPRPVTTHGDIGFRNAALTPRGPALIDLETMTVSHPGFDQAALAWDCDVFGADPALYAEFADAYGYDITTTGAPMYEAMTPIFGITAFLAYAEWSRTQPEARLEADHRLRTLLSRRPLPWDWTLGLTRISTPNRHENIRN